MMKTFLILMNMENTFWRVHVGPFPMNLRLPIIHTFQTTINKISGFRLVFFCIRHS